MLPTDMTNDALEKVKSHLQNFLGERGMEIPELWTHVRAMHAAVYHGGVIETANECFNGEHFGYEVNTYMMLQVEALQELINEVRNG